MQFSPNISKNFLLPVDARAGQPELGVVQYLSLLWRRRITVAAALVVTLLVAFVYLLVAPIRYTATTVLVLDTRRLPFAQSEGFVDTQDYEPTIQSQIETIKSANVATIVIKKLKLTEDDEIGGLPTFLEGMLARWSGEQTVDPREGALRQAIERFDKALRVTRSAQRSSVVEIAYTSLDPKKAAVIANATAEAYIEDQLQAKFEVANRAGRWLQQRVSEFREQATDAYRTVQEFKSQTNLIVSDGKLGTELELAEMTDSLAKARAETALARSRMEQIDSVLSSQSNDDGLPDGTVTDALNNTVVVKLRQEYLEQKARASEWAVRYGQTHQAVLNLRSEMASLKRGIYEEMQRIAKSYKSDFEIARGREEAIEKRLTEVFQNNRETRQSQVKLQELQSAANSYRSIYENLLNRYTEAVQQQTFPSTEARIITFASLGKKTSPKIVLTLVLALAGGGVLGIAMAYLREQMDGIIYTRDLLVRETGGRCIAILPATDQPEDTVGSKLQATTSRTIGFRGRNLPSETIADSPKLLYRKEEPFSLVSEALRNIKVAVDIRSISHDTRVLAIVSALPGEGKSSLAASIAATAAEAGRRALVIDCDFRNPSLTHLLGPTNRAGVIELLQGTASIDDVVNQNPQYRFDFLGGPTEVRPVHTADLLNSDAMKRLLTAARERYDYVIVDLPPIVPVIDVSACSHLFDAFVLVVEWGRTTVDNLTEALQIAPLVHERLLGVVLNKVDIEAMRRIEGYRSVTYGRYTSHPPGAAHGGSRH